jgi:ABC-type transport system substrate-binding protein
VKKGGPHLFVALACQLALAACHAPEAPPTHEIFRASHDEEVQSWDPAVAFDETSLDVLAEIYEPLYQYDYLSEEYRLVPLLAADHPTYSEDRLTIKIPIRTGVRFADDACLQGPRVLRAKDFVFSLKRLAVPELNSSGWWMLAEKISGMKAFRAKLARAPHKKRAELLLNEPVAGLSAEGDSTLVIHLDSPLPQIEHLLAMTFVAPIPGECAESIANRPVGTGPFRLKEWVHGSKTELERNPAFHAEFYPTEGSADFMNRGWLADSGKTLPLVDGIAFELFRDKTQAWQRFLAGTIDALRIPKDRLQQSITNQVNLSPELEAKGVRLSIEAGSAFSYLIFNMRDGVVGRKKLVRQAIASAINRDKWMELITSSTAHKMTTLLPPGVKDRPEGSTLRYDYEVDRARTLLGKAGYPGGKGLPPLTLDLRSGDNASQQLGELFKRELGEVGIRLKVRLHGFQEYMDRIRKGRFQLAYGNWGMDYPDAQNVFQLLYGPNAAPGPNLASFNDRKMNTLYERMSLLEPGTERAKLIVEMDNIAQEELPWVPGFFYSRYTLTQPWVLNFRNNGMILNKFKYVRVNPALKARYLEVK